LLFKTVLT